MKFLKKLLIKFIKKRPKLLLLSQIFNPKIPSLTTDVKSFHNKYIKRAIKDSTALDLGCGLKPKNLFHASKIIGIDKVNDHNNEILKCNLGFEKLPFKDNYFDYLTAYDLIEHIPRFYLDNKPAPFIFFMNECFRVLKKDGIFLSITPIYPYFAAFQDPTHNNIITADTFKLYFSNKKYDSAKNYGIETSFIILEQKMLEQHLIAVMSK